MSNELSLEERVARLEAAVEAIAPVMATMGDMLTTLVKLEDECLQRLGL